MILRKPDALSSRLHRQGLAVVTLLTLALVTYSLFPYAPRLVPFSEPLLHPGDAVTHDILYNSKDSCSFLDPVLGLSKSEQKLVHSLSTHKHGHVSGVDNEIHPIFGLLARGEAAFRSMIARRSNSLEEAIREYERRYRRPPPEGFGEWWKFASEHNVFLPDEYDSIEESVGPFRAFRPADLKERIVIASKINDTTMIKVEGGVPRVQYTPGLSVDKDWTHRRSDPQADLLRPHAHNLPNMTMVLGLRDEPTIMMSNELRASLVSRSSNKTASGQQTNPYIPYTGPIPASPWALSCPPASPLRQGVTETPCHTSFISSHQLAQDPCYHPFIVDNHGLFLPDKGKWTNPTPRYSRDEHSLVPVMCLSKTRRNGDILTVPFDPDDFEDDVESSDRKRWEEKEDKMYWRGMSTGMYPMSVRHGSRWRQSHRHRLHRMANPVSNVSDIPVLLAAPSTGMAKTVHVDPHAFKDWGYDVKLAGKPRQCDVDDGTCEEMEKTFDFVAKSPRERGNDFKYVFDVDGNAWTTRFRRLIMSNSLVLKATVFPEWNSAILPEWFAYVPIKMDYSDIPSVLAFFRGPPPPYNGSNADRDEVARRIAHNGKCWVEKTWRRVDVEAYIFRLWLEWARILGERGDFEMDDV